MSANILDEISEILSGVEKYSIKKHLFHCYVIKITGKIAILSMLIKLV